MNNNKTQSKATLGKKSSKGPRCQETKGEGSTSARQETPSKRSYDSPRVVKTPKGDEDRYTYDELMDMYANIVKDMEKQGEEIEKLKKVVTYQNSQIEWLKKMVNKLMHNKAKKQFVLKRRSDVSNDAPKKERIRVIQTLLELRGSLS